MRKTKKTHETSFFSSPAQRKGIAISLLLTIAAFTSQSCSNGSYAFTPGRMSFQETPCVEVTDTVGAGDSFTGAFCAAILKGLPVTEAHKLATKVSAYVYTQSEAMPTQPKEIIGKANR